ncbi:hypothetical protein ACFLU5_04045 [Bacteroidota bacterium]
MENITQFNSTEKLILDVFKRHGVSMSRCLQTPRLNYTARFWDPKDRDLLSTALISLINKGILRQNKAGFIMTYKGSRYLYAERRTQYPASV